MMPVSDLPAAPSRPSGCTSSGDQHLDELNGSGSSELVFDTVAARPVKRRTKKRTKTPDNFLSR
jgi:hypothetical protein